MSDLLKHAIYVKFKGKEDPELVREMQKWLEPFNHQIRGWTYNWRELQGWQCHALHGYLEGAWLQIMKKGTCYPDVDYDPGVLMLFKLTWGGQ